MVGRPVKPRISEKREFVLAELTADLARFGIATEKEMAQQRTGQREPPVRPEQTI